MRETFPIKLLQRVLQATPEELAAIEHFLGGQPLPEWQQNPPPVNGASETAPPKPPVLDQQERSIAAKVFELLTALDPDSRVRKAPPIKVFLLRFRKNLSRAEIARICGCDKSLVALRLKTIRDKLPWQPQQLQQMSAQVEAMQDAVSDSRARRIYRKGALWGGEEGDEGPD